MPLIAWRDEFSTGDPAVDFEHRELINLINELHEQLSAGSHSADDVENFLGEINLKISAHFALEERIMREANYDGYDAHKDDHENLLDGIREIMIDYDAGAYSEFEETLARNLDSWFTNHFKTHDAKLHAVFGHEH